MRESIVQALAAARRISLRHRAAFPDGNAQPGIYLNHPRLFKEREKNLLHHFKEIHGHGIELWSFPQARIGAGLYDKTRMNGGAGDEIKIFACVENYSGTDQNSRVFVNDALNYCHKRFYALKELLHLVTITTDNATVGSADIDALLDKLVGVTLESNGQRNADADAEDAAYFGAIELLLNKESVNDFLVNNVGVDMESAAELLSRKYYLPKKWVTFRLRHADFFNHIYDEPAFAELG